MGVASQTHLSKFSHQTMMPNLVKCPQYVQGYDTDFLPQVQVQVVPRLAQDVLEVSSAVS